MKFSTAYHPQIDGQIEVVHMSLGNLLRFLVNDYNRNWDLILPSTQFAYNSSVNRSISISPFEVVHGYKPRKPLYLLPISLHTTVSELTESFARKIQDLHVEITKQIQVSNVQYKLRADLHRRYNEFNVRDYVMIRIKPRRFPLGTNRELHVRSAWPFKVLQRVGPYAYVLDLPREFGINSTFNIKDLVAYHKPLPIPNNPFEKPPNFPPDDLIETFIPFILTLTQKG